MLTEVCQYLRNWFDKGRFFGTFRIDGGALTDKSFLTDSFLRPLEWPDELRTLLENASGEWKTDDILQEGQYFRIVGSIFNDGVYQYPATGLQDEVFEGALWVMAVPPAVITLNEEIESWINKYEELITSPYTNESFGGYTYSKPGLGSGSGVVSWEDVFKRRLSPWRKI